jgi:hypothetical protein
METSQRFDYGLYISSQADIATSNPGGICPPYGSTASGGQLHGHRNFHRSDGIPCGGHRPGFIVIGKTKI